MSKLTQPSRSSGLNYAVTNDQERAEETKQAVDSRPPTPQVGQENLAELLEEFLPMIRRIASAMAAKNPFSLDIEDLTSAGVMGLLSASKRFDPTREIKFRTFAEYRIRGMMLDEIRMMDWVPRSVRSRRDQIRQVIEEFQHKHDHPPTIQQIGKTLGVSEEELEQILGYDPRLISLDEPVAVGEDSCTLRDVLPDSDNPDPFMACVNAEMKAALEAALVTLSDRQREVLHLYYHLGLTLKEIGKRLGLTESGVCRIHAGALRQLRIQLLSIDEERGKSHRPRNLRRPQPSAHLN